jgi:glycosyltransferase involved in cell wall biosynthesis
MAKLNILIYEPYPFRQISGNLRTQSYIMEFIDKRRFHLVFLAPFETDFTKKVQMDGIDTVVLEPSKRINRYGGKCLQDSLFRKVLTMLDLFQYNLKLYRVFKKKNIDVLYCNCIRSVLTVWLAAVLRRTPILWYIKGELQNPILDTIGFILCKKILFYCETNKNDKYPRKVKRYKNKIEILGPGIDLKHIVQVENKDKTNLKKELSIDDDKINILYMGQLCPLKGVHYLLDAISLIVQEYPNIMLYIVGDHIIEEYKSYTDELVRITKKYKLERNVFFTGWRSDALEILSLMDILVHPSLSEGYGRVAVEAMALGKAVVCSKTGGLRELIKDGENGFLVEPRDSYSITKKLSILLREKTLRDEFGKAAREKVFSGFMIQDKIRKLEQIWSELVSKR